MPHIHNGEGEHDLTASAFIIREMHGQFVVLMHKHKKIDRIMQPGGHVELTENPYQAVLREVEEETGYLPEQLHPMERSVRTGSFGFITTNDPQPFYVNTLHIQDDPVHFHTDLSYVFFVTEEPKATPLEGESTEFYWLEESQIPWDERIPRNVRKIACLVFEIV